VGTHDAPESWLQRWQEQEPVRLYLWGVASAVLVGCVVAGWLTQELALAIAGPVSAALMIGGTAAARADVFSPATVARLQAEWRDQLEEELDSQHGISYRAGWDAGVQATVRGQAETERTPEQVAIELLQVADPQTTALAATVPCEYTEDGRRCTLPFHPGAFPHRLEEEGAGE
jgi:hypothetical protein